MDVHRPKPVHGWRDLVKEIGVIVIGVAIALAAEQVVEWVHWQQKVSLAREQFAGEMAFDINGAIGRIRSSKCVEQRLDALALVLDGAAKSGNLPPVGDIGLPRQQSFLSGVWDSMVASQTAPHFPTGELQNLAGAYFLVHSLGETIRQEQEEWKSLYTMVGPGRRLDSASEAVLRQALSHARTSNRGVTNQSNQFLRLTKDLELHFSRDDRAYLTRAKQIPLTGTKPTLYAPIGFSICEPIGSVPPNYGQAPLSVMPSLLDQAVKAIPDYSEDAK